MARQIVMDHAGDSRHYFDRSNPQSLASAKQRFDQLTGRGFLAAIRSSSGEIFRVTSFDPNAEETVFFPRLVGG